MKYKILKLFTWVIIVGVSLLAIASLHTLTFNRQELGSVIRPLHNIDITDKPLDMPTAKTTRAPSIKNISHIVPESKKGPVTHIGFLKVHKAASTTTQAIFLRFGWRRNLTFVLSPEYNKFGYPNIISTNESITKYNTLPPPPGRTFDILCNHVVYGQKEWATVLPADSLMVGTIREPFSHFKSVLNYFNPRPIAFVQTSLDRKDPVGTFLKSPFSFESKDIRTSFTNNRLSFEYGVEPEIILKRDVAAFDKYLYEVLDKQFAVVILAEMFDESLVLMKRKLNWELKDIMYAMKNVRSSKRLDRYHVTEAHKALHRNYSVFDYMLYDFFKDRLYKQIEAEGPEFEDEVKHFKDVRRNVEHFCHQVSSRVRSMKIEASEWTHSFIISRDDCSLMHVGEIQFVQMIRKAQYGSASWNMFRPVRALPQKP